MIFPTLGVYLSYDGTVLEPNSMLHISNIGTSPRHQLSVICTTDRIPCCQEPQPHGEWKFPNGTLVTEQSTAFRRNRDNNGNVNLYRVSSDVVSPTGRFCCEIDDATWLSPKTVLCVSICEFDVIHSSSTNTCPCLTFQSLYKLRSVYIHQLLEKVMCLLVMYLELVPTPMIGVKTTLKSLKMDKISPSLHSDWLMLDATAVLSL